MHHRIRRPIVRCMARVLSIRPRASFAGADWSADRPRHPSHSEHGMNGRRNFLAAVGQADRRFSNAFVSTCPNRFARLSVSKPRGGGMLALRFSGWLLVAALPLYAWSATLVVPTQFATIQSAIDQAQPLDVVVVEPGTYRENVTLKSQVDVVGREAARTLLEPQSSQLPTVRIRLANDVRLSGFTLIGSATGIEV